MGMTDMTEGEAELLLHKFKTYLGSVGREIQNRRLKERSKKMGMSIEEAIYILENGLNIDGSWHKALHMAFDTMRKYQKIEELYDYWRSGKCEYTISCMENIGKVLRDGND